MGSDKIVIRIIAGTIFLLDWLMPAVASKTQAAIQEVDVTDFCEAGRLVLKVVIVIILVIPAIPLRIKQWAYVGFGISVISACVAHWGAEGMGFQTLLPVIGLFILDTSYVSYYRLQNVELRLVNHERI